MLEISFNKHKYYLPQSWDELTQEQFIYLTSLMLQCNAGMLSIDNSRVLFACHILGLSDRQAIKLTKNNLFNENIFRIASELRFMFKYEYANQKSFNKFPLETRNALLRYDPEELGDSSHVRVARKMTKTIEVDNVFANNLIPTISKRRKKLTGYQFTLNNGILTSNLTAQQFSDALTVYQKFIQDKQADENLINTLIGILYCNPYSNEEAMLLSKNIDWINPAIKQAVVYNFMAIQTFLFTRTKYKVLFNSSKKTKTQPKNSLGFSGSIYSMVRKGYGDLDAMSNQNIIKFFEAMYSDLVSTLQSLKDSDMDITDIAAKTGLTVATINNLT